MIFAELNHHTNVELLGPEKKVHSNSYNYVYDCCAVYQCMTIAQCNTCMTVLQYKIVQKLTCIMLFLTSNNCKVVFDFSIADKVLASEGTKKLSPRNISLID